MPASASSRLRARMAATSAPETNALSPAPVITSTVALASRTSSRARWNSPTVAVSSALRTCGRFTVSVETRPSCASVRFS